MKFEKRVSKMLFLFIFICYGTVAVLAYFYCDLCVLKIKSIEIQVYILIAVIVSVVNLFAVVKMTAKDRELFIKSVIFKEKKVLKEFREYRKLDHVYRMHHHSLTIDSVEKLHLESLIEYSDTEITLIEKEIRQLEQESEYLSDSLKLSENVFMGVANRLNEGIWITDPDGIILFANKYLVRKMKVTVGDHVSGIFNLSKDDCAYFFVRDFKDIEVRLWDKEGSKVLLSNSRVKYNGALNHVLFLCKEQVEVDDFIRRNQNFNFIFDTFDTLSKNVIDKQSIENFLEKMCLFGEFKSASVRLISDDKKTLGIYAVHQDSPFVLNNEKIRIEKNHMVLAYRSGSPVLINRVSDLRMEEPYIKNLVEKGYGVNYFPLRIQGIDIGVLSIISPKPLSSNMVLLIKALCINLTIALEKILIYDTLKNNFFDIIGAFFLALEMKSMHLRGHSARVAMVCKLIAEQLYYSAEEIDNLYSAALLHDVGKLLFVDKSYKHVFDIHEHGYLGRMIMERIGARDDIIKGIECHHDNYRTDKGVQPIFAQFIRLSNDFDIFFYVQPTLERAREYIDKVARREQGVYSSNLVNVLENIIETKPDQLLEIYEVADA